MVPSFRLMTSIYVLTKSIDGLPHSTCRPFRHTDGLELRQELSGRAQALLQGHMHQVATDARSSARAMVTQRHNKAPIDRGTSGVSRQVSKGDIVAHLRFISSTSCHL